ncbi:4Fe-4S binding protein [Candidatus Woesearchaeota archaeon]|nr:4Fe-4S binding protein [Candidatus Woesearchaeota archaeon]
MVKRNIVHIDEEKCNGCGLCVPNCHEGALQIINGKARLVSDVYCDGLGNCLGHCPQDAITILEKEVAGFDFKATNEHLRSIGREELDHNPLSEKPKGVNHLETKHTMACGCPGTMVREFGHAGQDTTELDSGKQESQLRQWPVQLNLVPPNAGFLRGADLLISADCVSAADPNFHSRMLKGRRLLMGCPKLDDIQHYKEKIQAIFELNDINTITVAIMEVPCCQGLYDAVEQALDESGKRITLRKVILGVDGVPRASDS